jgi:hypothetical protein
MNFLLPIRKAANPLLPLKELAMKMATTPLASKLAALESDMLALEKQMEKKTVRALVTERIRDPARWAGDPDGSGDAATLAASPPGADGEETDPEQAAAEFDALVREVAQRDGIPLAEAARRARQENPDVYDAMTRTDVAKSFNEMVADEIGKGFSHNVARQKVSNAYPQAARESIAKSQADVADFMCCVTAIQKRDQVNRTTAMARARKAHPSEFSRFQNV